MGCFSWKFANEANRKRLVMGSKAYVPCPDGSCIYEPFYNGYGDFGGNDIYELVALWNREYLSKHPEFVIPDRNGEEGYAVSDAKWYAEYAAPGEYKGNLELREIGIRIACYDNQNRALPYPIKICSRECRYDEVKLSSNSDPRQGAF